VKRLRASLAREHGPQLRSGESRAHLKAVAFAWFQSYKPSILRMWPTATLTDIDALFQELLTLSEKAPSAAKVRSRAKDAQVRLVALQGVLVAAAPAVTADVPPSFGAVPDPAMRQVLTRRWNECVACLGAGAPLAATVMMGGLLESLFLARVNREPSKQAVFTASAAPKDAKTHQTLSLKDWTLKDYIAVAHELRWIPPSVRDVGQIVRDYRNYIHPQKELSHQIALTLEDARMFWQLSKAVAGHLL
jgi:hypothetical protein